MKIVSSSIWGPTTDTKCSYIFTQVFILAPPSHEECKWTLWPLLLKFRFQIFSLSNFLITPEITKTEEILEVYLNCRFLDLLFSSYIYLGCNGESWWFSFLFDELSLVICVRTVLFIVTFLEVVQKLVLISGLTQKLRYELCDI